MAWNEVWILLLGATALLGLAAARPQEEGARHSLSNSEQYYYETGYMSDFNTDWSSLSGRLNQPKCIDIPANLTLCRNIGYTQMRIPNLLDHDSIREVTQQAASWVPLMNIQCHPDTQLFLCSLFSPVCLDRPIPPCRALCMAVKEGCESRMAQYGFPWPEMLRCDKFPLKNDLCIGLQTENKPDESVCDACNHPKTFEAIVDSYCQADFVFKFKVDENVVSESDLKIIANKKKKLYKKGSLKKRDIHNLTLYIGNGLHCDCAEIENPTGNERSTTEYIGMGNKIGEKLYLNFVQKYNKKDPDLKKAMRAMRKETICQDGIKEITGDGTVPEEDVEEKDKNGKGNGKNGNGKSKDRKGSSDDNGGKGRKNRERRKGKEDAEAEVEDPVGEVESNAASGRKSREKGRNREENNNNDNNRKDDRRREKGDRKDRKKDRNGKESKNGGKRKDRESRRESREQIFV